MRLWIVCSGALCTNQMRDVCVSVCLRIRWSGKYGREYVAVLRVRGELDTVYYLDSLSYMCGLCEVFEKEGWPCN